MAVDTLCGYTDLRTLVDITAPDYTYHEENLIQQQVTGPGPKDLPAEPGDRSRPATKEASRLSRQGSQERQESKGGNRKSDSNKPASKQSKSQGSSKSVAKEGSTVEDPEAAEDGDPEKKAGRGGQGGVSKARSSLETVQEVPTLEFEDEFELTDEPSWSSVPFEHIPGRFLQFRHLTKKKLGELEGEMDSTVKKTAKKVTTLKAQFQEHKTKWEVERDLLISHIDQAQVLHQEAEAEAEVAIIQLEEILDDQEELEREEEKKRQDVVVTQDREATLTLPEATQDLEETLQNQANLMAMTDDAKAEMTRKTSKLSEQWSGSDTQEVLEELQIPAQSPEVPGQRDEMASRSSVRSHHSLVRQVLSSLKAAAQQRRAKSPSVYSIISQKSVLEDAKLDEDGDMPFPVDETPEERAARLSFHDMATSPMSRERTLESSASIRRLTMYEHPIVQEFLKTYNSVQQFRENLSRAFMDREMNSLGQILAEIEPMELSEEEKVQPQIEEMQKNVTNILEETMALLNSLLASERDYPVSSLLGMSSKEATRTGIFTRDTHLSDRAKSRNTDFSVTSKASSSKEHLRELQDQYLHLQKMADEENKKFEDQLNHNTVVMMEMQDTIHKLQRELSILGHDKMDQPAAAMAHDGPIMFTRLDSERNAKIMKRAVNENRLVPDKYERAVDTMEDYVSLPAKRLTHLVHKYVHHVQMKQVEENVRKSKALDDDVFQILDKMEALQNERARKWGEKMDDMGSERMKLVSDLMSTFADIEQDSGVFLIKPMYSYKKQPERLQGKQSRAHHRAPADAPNSRITSAYAPVPTPASNRGTERHYNKQLEPTVGLIAPPSNPEDGISGTASRIIGEGPRPVWNQAAASDFQDVAKYNAAVAGQINTPRILELDINRMLIGQNQVSLNIPQGFVSDDRLANAANSSIHSYVTVNRPTGHPGPVTRPRSHTGASEAPPATPMLDRQTPTKSEHLSRAGSNSAGSRTQHLQSEVSRSPTPHTFPSTPPLPPIGSEHAGTQGSAIDSVSSMSENVISSN